MTKAEIGGVFTGQYYRGKLKKLPSDKNYSESILNFKPCIQIKLELFTKWSRVILHGFKVKLKCIIETLTDDTKIHGSVSTIIGRAIDGIIK